MGFFDLSDRYASLDAKKYPLSARSCCGKSFARFRNGADASLTESASPREGKPMDGQCRSLHKLIRRYHLSDAAFLLILPGKQVAGLTTEAKEVRILTSRFDDENGRCRAFVVWEVCRNPPPFILPVTTIST
jgi:hypothetical protein